MDETPDCSNCTGRADENTGNVPVGRREVLVAGARIGALATVASFVRGLFGVVATSASTVKKTAIATTSHVRVGSAYAFIDPNTHKPAYALQPKEGHFIALSRICPHLGCTVDFDSTKFVCPCHGSEFSTTGALLHGPATRGLTSLPVTVSSGEIYLET